MMYLIEALNRAIYEKMFGREVDPSRKWGCDRLEDCHPNYERASERACGYGGSR